MRGGKKRLTLYARMDEGGHSIQSLNLCLCVCACVAVCRKQAVAHVLAGETWEQGETGSRSGPETKHCVFSLKSIISVIKCHSCGPVCLMSCNIW